MKKTIETNTIIQQRVEKINEAVSQLKKYREISQSEFIKDKKTQYAAMFAMIIGIEAICDIGNHILSRYFNRSAESYKDVILTLGEVEVIPEKFAKKSSQMVDFRNLLIHIYLKVDPLIVYKNLKKAPEEFTQFCQYFLKFIGQ